MDRTNVRASLRIVGECFDVQRVTDTLEVTPSRTWNKGEPIRNSGKIIHVQRGFMPQNPWNLRT